MRIYNVQSYIKYIKKDRISAALVKAKQPAVEFTVATKAMSRKAKRSQISS